MTIRAISHRDLGLSIVNPDNKNVSIDILAIHGRGAHPNDTWRQLREDATDRDKDASYINWLSDPTMLPDVLPHARIMRYGYRSEWFGPNRLRVTPQDISRALLRELRRNRQDCSRRPIICVAHSFGGLVLLQTLIHACRDLPEFFSSTIGLIFFGTPFRGNRDTTHVALTRLAQENYPDEEVFEEQLRTSHEGDVYLQSLVEEFQRLIRGEQKPKIACFYEQRPTNISVLFQDRRMRPAAESGSSAIESETPRTQYEYWVDETAATLDVSDHYIDKYPRACTHFNLHRYETADCQDFRDLRDVLREMDQQRSSFPEFSPLIRSNTFASTQPEPVITLDDYNISFSLLGMPCINHFVARPHEMDKLRSYVSSPLTSRQRSVFAVYGMGGAGKTQLCCHFVREHKDEFTAIFWLDGSSKSALYRSMAAASQRIGASNTPPDPITGTEQDGVERQRQRLVSWLSLKNNTKWLLVLDNVDREWQGENPDEDAYDPDTVLPMVDHGSILITTRLARLGVLASASLELRPVDDTVGKAIIERLAGRALEGVTPLLAKLGGLPLALVQAGAYLAVTGQSVSNYLAMYDEKWRQLMRDQSRYSNARYESWNILTTFKLSYDQVQHQSSQAASLLDLLSFFDYHDIWDDLVVCSATATPAISWDRFSFNQSVGILSQYSLLLTGDSLSIHPIIHEWTRHNMIKDVELDDEQIGKQANRAEQLHAQATRILALKTREAEHNPTLAYRLAAHVQTLARNLPYAGLSRSVSGDLYDLGRFLDKWWLSNEVGHLYANAMIRNSIHHGVHDSSTLVAMNIFRHACSAMERYYGSYHPDTLLAVRGLAHVYLDLGQLMIAEPLYEHSLAGSRVVYGESHTLTLDAKSSLATIHAAQGWYKRALDLLHEVLLERQTACGSDDLSTLRAVNDLGNIFFHQNALEDAATYLERAYQGFKVKMGLIHRITFTTGTRLAIVWARRKDFARSDQLFGELGAVLEGLHEPSGERAAILAYGMQEVERARHS